MSDKKDKFLIHPDKYYDQLFKPTEKAKKTMDEMGIFPDGADLGFTVGKRDMKQYYRKLISTILLISSVTLLIEHIWNWGYIELTDFIGHEFYAIIMFIVGVVLVSKELKQWLIK